MVYDKWSDDEFLDLLQQHTDELADRTVARLIEENGIREMGSVFRMMTSDDCQIPADAPAVFHEFVAQTRELPANIDRERVARLDSILPYGPVACMVMLASSLPQGYSAPRISRILTISDDLGTHPYKRLMGVLQLLVNLGGKDAFAPGGCAVVTAQKMRLLHAGMRLLVPKHRPEYEEQFGVAINMEDNLGTIMGFSFLVLEGLRKIKCRVTNEAAEDRYYRWRVFAQLMGIHPPGRPDDDSWIPANLDEASRFYRSYVRRHYTGAAENPDGVRLSRRNLEMMRLMVPKPLRWIGRGIVPHIAMTELLTPEEMARTGISPLPGHGILKAFFTVSAHLFYGFWNNMPPNLVQVTSHLMHKEMIKIGRGGEVTFEIPASLENLRGEGFV
jgi:hypothetical protein